MPTIAARYADAEVLPGLEFTPHDREIAIDLRVGRGPAPGARGESHQAVAGFRHVAVFRGDQPFAFLPVGVGQDRPFRFHPIDDQHRIDRLPLLVEQLIARRPLLSAVFRVPKRELGVAQRVPVGEHAGRFVLHVERPFRQERFDFEDRRFIFRREDIPPHDGPLLPVVPQGEVGHPPLEGWQGTELDANAIQAGRTGADEMLAVTGPEQPAFRPGMSLLFPLPLVGGLPRLLRFRRGYGKGAFEDGLRGAEVSLHVRRRKGEQRTDAIEPVPAGSSLNAPGMFTSKWTPSRS